MNYFSTVEVRLSIAQRQRSALTLNHAQPVRDSSFFVCDRVPFAIMEFFFTPVLLYYFLSGVSFNNDMKRLDDPGLQT